MTLAQPTSMPPSGLKRSALDVTETVFLRRAAKRPGCTHDGQESRQVGLNEAPDENLVDLRVPVNQHIAEGDEAQVFGDAFRRLGSRLASWLTASSMISNSPFHGGLQHDVTLIVARVFPSGEPTDQSRPPDRCQSNI